VGHVEQSQITGMNAPKTAVTEIAVAVVEQDGHYLIGQRPAGVPLAGLWEFPGGKIEAGESPENAAVRETQEEAGIEIVVDGEYPEVVHQYDHGKLRLHFFRCRPRDDRQSPTSRFQWVPRASLRNYEFPAANAGLIAYLLQRQV
jgi:8-oxo-dGTP diphosphatase